MAVDYPTDPQVLLLYTDEQWTELLTMLEKTKLGPRLLVRLEQGKKKWKWDGERGPPKNARSLEIIEALRKGGQPVEVARYFGVTRQRVHQLKKYM